jgi:hypothetical protein
MQIKGSQRTFVKLSAIRSSTTDHFHSLCSLRQRYGLCRDDVTMSSCRVTALPSGKTLIALPFLSEKSHQESALKSLKMVSSCCVRDCHNRQDREQDRRYFVVPRVVTGKGPEMKELTSRRRREWIAQLNLKTLTFDTIPDRYVCSDHFINGKRIYRCS